MRLLLWLLMPRAKKPATPAQPPEQPAQQDKLEKRPVGRPSALTDDVRLKFIQALKAGSYADDAAKYAGIGYSTWMSWQARARKEQSEGIESEYTQFLEQVENVRAEAVVADLTQIVQQGATSWQALAWRLERMYPEKFGRRDKLVIEQQVKVEVATVMVGVLVSVLERTVHDAELRQVILANFADEANRGGSGDSVHAEVPTLSLAGRSVEVSD